MIRAIYRWLDAHANFTRGLSGVAAIAVLTWGLVWPWVEKQWFTSELFVLHSLEYGELNGDRISTEIKFSQYSVDCAPKPEWTFTGANGEQINLNFEGGTVGEGTFSFTFDLKFLHVPAPQDGIINGRVRYSSPLIHSCNRVYEFPSTPYSIKFAADD